MKRFARALAAILSIVVLGSFVVLVPQKTAIGAGSAPVTIMNTATNAVPVTGSVSATVSGTVGVNNFPATQNVNITNTAAPLLVKSVDEPGRAPYQQTVQIPEANSGCVQGFCDSTFTFPAVPANKRLVIQYVSADLLLSSGGVTGGATLGPTGPGNPLPLGGHVLPLTLQSSFQGVNSWMTSQQVTFYVDPLQQPTIDILSDSGHTLVSGAINATITGYLVSLP